MSSSSANAADRMAAPDDSKWLLAFSDPLATLYTFTQCIALADLSGDGDHKLIVADLGTGLYNMKLKVYRGTAIMAENTIIDLPTAVVPFFMDTSEPRIPSIAVASGSGIFVYRNLKPYYKFNLPNLEVNQIEQTIWEHVKDDKLDLKTLNDALDSLKSTIGISSMSNRSQNYLLLSEQDQKEKFVGAYQNEALKRQSIATCLCTIKKSSHDRDAIDSLVVGTEHCLVYIVDSEAFTVLAEAQVPAVPVFICAMGLVDVEYRLLVCCRNACIYSIKRSTKAASRAIVELGTQAVGICRIGKTMTIGCTDHTLRCHSVKGKRLWSLTMPAKINSIEALDYPPRNYSAVIVALDNNEVHIYKDLFLIDVIKTDQAVTGLKFGCFGREEGALIFAHRGGGISARLLKRTAKLEEKAACPGPPLSQNQKLSIPKKTKVFVDQTIRERDHSVKMHQKFQRDLFMLRLHTARAYAKTLQSKQQPLVETGEGEMLKIDAEVHGFGPEFLLKLFLQCLGEKALTQLEIVFKYNERLYQLEQSVIPVPMLVPGVQYPFESRLRCLSDKGQQDEIKAYVFKDSGPDASGIKPLISAIISMPVSEMPLVA